MRQATVEGDVEVVSPARRSTRRARGARRRAGAAGATTRGDTVGRELVEPASSSPKAIFTTPAVGGGQGERPDGRVLDLPRHVDEPVGVGPGERRGHQVGHGSSPRVAGPAGASAPQSGADVVVDRRSCGHLRGQLVAETLQPGPDVLTGRVLAAPDHGRHLGVRPVEQVALHDSRALLGRQLAHRGDQGRRRRRASGRRRRPRPRAARPPAPRADRRRRAWSTTLRWAIVKSQPRRLSACRRSG